MFIHCFKTIDAIIESDFETLVSVDEIGDKIAEGSRDKEEVLIGKVDLFKAEKLRTVWGTFRDRRPELYKDLLNLDGSQSS